MTMLSEEQIINLQGLYKKHFGEDISREQAAQEGTQLIELVKAILQTHVSYEN